VCSSDLLIVEIASHFGQGAGLLATMQTDLIVGATLLGVVSWLGGILLLVTNRRLYRFLEGYGDWNPLKIFGGLQKKNYTRLLAEIEKLDEQFREQKDQFPRELRDKRNRLMREKVERYPDREGLLLPTSFGNILRAFEVYPRVMYGLESIDGWSRLLAVIPKDYRELIDNAKSQVDFWVNIGFLSVLLLIEYIGLAIYTKILVDWWIAVLILLTAMVSLYFAQNSAIEWGDFVKAAFDVYRFRLIEMLSIDIPRSRDDEGKILTRFSQAIVYRIPYVLPKLKNVEIKKPKEQMPTTNEPISIGGHLDGNLISGSGNTIYVNANRRKASASDAPLVEERLPAPSNVEKKAV
jgi:hypothetical protein